MDFKNTKRKEIANKLNLLGENRRTQKSKAILANLISTRIWEESESIFIYIDFKTEVKTEEIVERALVSSKNVYIPYINGKEMTFHKIEGLQGLIVNRFGIKEPDPTLPVGAPDSKSIMILPGVGFTKKGERLGRGGGFYDRYLSKHMNGVKVAIAYREQIVDNLETDPWDQKADILITDLEIEVIK